MCPGKVGSSCFTSDTRGVTLVKNPVMRKELDCYCKKTMVICETDIAQHLIKSLW